MEINTRSIDALRYAARDFADSCRHEVADYEQHLSQIQYSGEEAVNAAQRVCDEFPPMIDDLKQKQYDHQKMLDGLVDLIGETKQDIETRKQEAERSRTEAAQYRAEEEKFRQLAWEAQMEANNCKEGEDSSGYSAVSDHYAAEASRMSELAAESEAKAEQLEREITGLEDQLGEFESKQDETKETLDKLDLSIRDADTRYNEAKYRLDELRNSVDDAVSAARRALCDSSNHAEDAEQYARRIAERAEEVNRIISDYHL